MGIKIHRITASETWPIRHAVLWPEKPLAYCVLEQDAEGWHFGAICNEKLVCVASVFFDQNRAQLRKFATLPEFQNLGIGSTMLKQVMSTVAEAGMEFFWCDARVSASHFYHRLGLYATGGRFERHGVEYIKMACQLPSSVCHSDA